VSRIERILIWSVDPRAPTAYGQQCGLLADALTAAGYDVAIGAMVARPKDEGRPWHGMQVWSVRDGRHGATHLKAKIRRHRADLVLMLFDSFMLDARLVNEITEEGCAVGYWAPVDGVNVRCGGLPILYRGMLRLAPRAVPIAMSRFGERLFREDGFDPLYVPHMLDPAFYESYDKAELREDSGIPADAFVITLCAANSDLVRKNFTGQFDAFGRAAEDNWLLLVHSDIQHPQKNTNSWDLDWLAAYYGIADKVRFPDPDRYAAARYTPADLAAWYTMGDLHTQCTMAEGFGIPALEAQACGLPVVATDGSAMTELAGPGWRIPSEPFMSPLIRAEWMNPPRALIANTYRQAAAMHPDSRAALGAEAREFAAQYSTGRVMADYWLPALKELENR
jgi:glycosyltransferase involved in cell wall biosynthesis